MSAGPSGSSMSVKRLQLFDLLLNDSLLSRANTAVARRKMVDYVKCNMPDLPEEEIVKRISLFSNKLVIRWKASGKNRKSFLKRNEDWLKEEIYRLNFQSHISEVTVTPSTRAVKQFDTLSARSKRRRTKKLVSSHSPEELVYATQSSLTKKGKRNIAHAIKKIVDTSPRSLRAIKKGQVRHSFVTKYTPEEALALIVDTKLSRSQYTKLRQAAKNKSCDLYPSYDEILKSKKACYPKEVIISETIGEVKLQSLLNHITYRLAIVQNEVLSRVIIEHDVTILEMTYKWGFDGSSSHSIYKQKFQESCDSIDSELLLTSIVPLKMTAKKDNREDIVWMNPRASSTRFCVPVKFQFIKETQDVILQENAYIEEQIAALSPTSINIQGKSIYVNHVLLKTMVDGKVANALAGNPSTQSCYICKIKPKDINNLEKVLKQSCNISAFNYGLSTLHAHIRFFECILHIAYRIDIKTWQVRGAENKAAYENKKRQIISKFRQDTGLLIDTIKQGSGTTNDGNTARRFFKDPKKVSEITKVDETLIKRFSIILDAISCGYEISTEKFRAYALETAKLFVKLYGWYKMPASVHKILIHGADVMNTLLVPIGQLSEEALEARHKECRYFREHNTRKIGRKENIEDLLHALFISSDMVISSLRPLPKKKLRLLPEEVINLLHIPECSPQTPTEQEEHEDSQSECLESEEEADFL